MQLRDFQLRALDAITAEFTAGKRAVLCVSPTGSGKTVMGTEAARRHVELACDTTVVWVAHRRELIQQAATTLRTAGLEVGAMGLNRDARVQVQSIQTLLRSPDVPQATLLIPDEAHHFLADDWGRLRHFFPNAHTLGFTATPDRGDGRPMGDMFQALVVAAQIRDLIDVNRDDPRFGLVPCDIGRPKDGPLAPGEIVRRPIDFYEEHGEGRRAVVFAPNTRAAIQFRDEFRERGIAAETVGHKTPKAERDTILRLFAEDKIRVVTNVQLLTEGWDDPGCKVGIIARGADHASLYIQMVGRIMRPHPDHRRALLGDLRGLSYIHGKPSDDRIYSLDGEPIRLAEKTRDDERMCPQCQMIYVGEGKCPRCGLATTKDAIVPEATGGEVEVLTASDEVSLALPGFAKAEPKVPPRIKALVTMTRNITLKGLAPDKAFDRARHQWRRVFGYHPSKDVLTTAKAILADEGLVVT